MEPPRMGVPAQPAPPPPTPPQSVVGGKRNSGVQEAAPVAAPPEPVVWWRLAVPTSFVWVVGVLQLVWRALGLHVQGKLVGLEPLDGALLAAIDLALTALAFLIFRLSVLGQSGDLNIRRALDVWTGTLLAVGWGLSTLLREAHLVYLTVFSDQHGHAAGTPLPHPLAIAQHPGTWLALVIALAFAALWRYSASCDLDEALEAAQVSGRVPVRKALVAISAGWLVVLTVASGLLGDQWALLPELELAGLLVAAQQ